MSKRYNIPAVLVADSLDSYPTGTDSDKEDCWAFIIVAKVITTMLYSWWGIIIGNAWQYKWCPEVDEGRYLKRLKPLRTAIA